jgi:hypothetical protein
VNNYHKTKLPDGTTRDTHRLLMEQSIGRRLRRNEHVHHINGDKRDNRLEILVVRSARDHLRLHFVGRPFAGHTPEGIAKLRERHSGERHTGVRLTDFLVLLAVEARRGGVPLKTIAKPLGISMPYASRITTGKKWVFTTMADPRQAREQGRAVA